MRMKSYNQLHQKQFNTTDISKIDISPGTFKIYLIIILNLESRIIA